MLLTDPLIKHQPGYPYQGVVPELQSYFKENIEIFFSKTAQVRLEFLDPEAVNLFLYYPFMGF